MQSYDYAQRTGTEEITWDRFADLARRLVEKLAPYNIEAVVGPARAGLFPATVVSLMLRRELYPARLTPCERYGTVPASAVDRRCGR